MPKTMGPYRCLCLVATFLLVASILSAAEDQREMYSIRIVNDRVVVPVWVYSKDAQGMPLRDIQPKEFEVFEDGVKQSVLAATFEDYYGTEVRHNLGTSAEYATTSRGIWRSEYARVGILLRSGLLSPTLGYYLVSYVPRATNASGCHTVKAHVTRKGTWVRAKDSYCSGSDPSDPLRHTALGRDMELDGTAADAGTIPLSIQAGFFRTEGHLARVHIAVDFSHYRFKNDWCGYTPKFHVGVLGLIYRKDGTLAKRFSDVRNGIWAYSCYVTGECQLFYDRLEALRTCPSCTQPPAPDCQAYWGYQGVLPGSFETQIEIPPGEYDLKIVLADGNEFGRVQVPLHVPELSQRQLSLSSIVLAKECHPPIAKTRGVAPEIVRLVSKGLEFTPAGESSFQKNEPVMAYFELYDPAADAASTTQFQMRVIEIKGGSIVIDSGPQSVTPWAKPGTKTFAIAREIVHDDLGPSAYRIEITAFDPARGGTASGTADFTLN